MTARRTLSPAARGVVLAVRAALRAGRVDLADQADGSTLATSTAPDGTVLLRAVLRLPVPGADPRQLTLPAVTAVPAPAEAPPAPVAVPAGDDPASDEPDPPVPNVSVLDASHGLAVGDIATLDDEDFRVTVADEWGWQGVTVATTPQGRPLANVHCDWNDVERVGPRAWRTRPTREKTRAERAEAAPVSKGAAKAPKREAPPKAKPARLVPVPEADALARYGERSIVAQLHEGDAWGLVWSDKLPGQMTYAVAVESVLEQAHAARIYDRGQHCVRDSRDGAK